MSRQVEGCGVKAVALEVGTSREVALVVAEHWRVQCRGVGGSNE